MPWPGALKRGAATTAHPDDNPPRHQLPPAESLRKRVAAGHNAPQVAAHNVNDLCQPFTADQLEAIPAHKDKPQADN